MKYELRKLALALGCIIISYGSQAVAQLSDSLSADRSALAPGDTVYVNDQLGLDTYDGLSPKTSGGSSGPKRTIAAAIALASAGQTVSVAATSAGYDDLITGAKSLRFTSTLGTPILPNISIEAATTFDGPFKLAGSGALTLSAGILTGARYLTISEGGTIVLSGGSLSSEEAPNATSYNLIYRTRSAVTSTSDEFIEAAVSSLTISDSGTVLTLHADRAIGNLILSCAGGGIVLGRSDGTTKLSLAGNVSITAGTFISRTLTTAAANSPTIAFIGTSPQTINVPPGEYFLPDGIDTNRDGDYLDSGDVPPVDVEINNHSNADTNRTITLTGGNLWMAGIGSVRGGTVWLKSGVVVTGSNAWHLSQGKNLATNEATQGFVRSPASGSFSHFVGNVCKFINALDFAMISSLTFPVGTLPSPRACYRPLIFSFKKGAGSMRFNLTVSHENSRPSGMSGFPIQTGSIVISDYADFDWFVRSDISMSPSQQYDLEAQAQGYTGYLQDGIQNVRLIRRDKPETILPDWKLVRDLINNQPVYENWIVAEDWPAVKSVNTNGGVLSQGAIFTYGKGRGGSFVVTRGSSGITSTTATLSAQIYPTSPTCTVWFEWGTSSMLSSYSATTAQSPGSGTPPLLVSASLTGLIPSTTYFYRVAGKDTGDVARGSIFNFSTAAQPVESGPTLLLPADTARSVSLTPMLTWSPKAGATYYELQVSAFYNFTPCVYDDTTSGVSQTVGPLNRDTKYFWRVRAITGNDFGPFSTIRGFATTVITAIGQLDEDLPREYALAQNYPNPFNPTTAISFQLSAVSVVTLKVIDVLGREIATLVNDVRSAGTYTVQWDASSFPSGTYFYRLQAGDASTSAARGFVETKKMILLR